MESQIIHIRYKVAACWWVISSLLSPFAAQGQTSPSYLSFVDEGVQEMIQRIELNTDYRFSYLPSSLPTQTYTASISLDSDSLAKSLSDLWQRPITMDGGTDILVGSEVYNKSYENTQKELIGLVLDANTGEPLPGAEILLSELTLGTITDSEGRFEVKGYFTEANLVRIRYLGYETRINTVSDIRIGAIRLLPRDHVLDDIVIKAQRKNLNIESLVDEVSLEKTSLPSEVDRDVFTLAQTIPGVYNSGESLQDLQIRGGPPDQVSYNWNSIRLFQNSLYYGRVSAVNPFMVDQVNITRNGASADEDASASGAINMLTDFDMDSQQSLRINANALYFNIGVEHEILDNKLKIRAALRQSYSPLFSSPIQDQYFENAFQFGKLPDVVFYLDSFEILDNTEITPELSFGDKTISLQYRPTEDSKVSANYMNYGNRFIYQLEDDFDDSIPTDSLVQNTQGYSTRWEQKWSRDITSTIDYAKSNYTHDYINTDDRTNEDTTSLRQENYLSQNNLQVDFNLQRRKYDLSLGYDFTQWEVTYNAKSSRENEQWFFFDQKGKGDEHSVYANLSLHSRPWYTLMLGVRHSSFSEALLGRNIIEPRLHASVLIDNNFSLHAHYGHFHQNLNRRVFTTTLGVDNGFWLLSDENVGTDNFIHIVQSKQGSIGSKYRKGRVVSGVDVYRKTAKDVWTSAFDFTTDEDLYEFTNLEIYGIEASVQYRINNWMVHMTYDYVNDKIITRETGIKLNSPYTQPHRFTFLGSWQKNEWTLSSSFRWSTGRTFSVPETIISIGEEGERFYELVFEDYFTRRVPNYARFDIGIEKKIYLSGLKSCVIRGQIMNVLNRENIVKSQYFVNYRPETPSQGFFSRTGLKRVWNLSIEVGF